MIKACDIRIYGRVFNVGFRRYVHRYAVQYGMLGYVENDYSDGSVHIVAEGEEKDLNRFAVLCGEGTPYSMVSDMKIDALEPSGAFTAFQQVR